MCLPKTPMNVPFLGECREYSLRISNILKIANDSQVAMKKLESTNDQQYAEQQGCSNITA